MVCLKVGCHQHKRSDCDKKTFSDDCILWVINLTSCFGARMFEENATGSL